jgi:hypothetical protein
MPGIAERQEITQIPGIDVREEFARGVIGAKPSARPTAEVDVDVEEKEQMKQAPVAVAVAGSLLLLISKMKILIINPNSSSTMTRTLEELLAPFGTPDVSRGCVIHHLPTHTGQ